MNRLHTLLKSWWDDFRTENQSADAAHTLLTAAEGAVAHDHIALRTFDDPTVHTDTVMAPLVAAGYVCQATYSFPPTHLTARHYEHHVPVWPKVFISQLELRHFTDEFQATIRRLLRQIPSDTLGTWEFFSTARPWTISSTLYETLKQESEYAAWVSAFGFRPTHFAVHTNPFIHYHELTALNALLKEHGFALNTSGGEIQGSPDVFLEQSSLNAVKTVVKFSDGAHPIPGTYYEFAKRYAMPNGRLFNGFNTESATHLFRTTHSSSRA